VGAARTRLDKAGAQGRRMPSRDGLLDKPMLAACGDVCDLTILDSGCGEAASLGSSSSAAHSGWWGLMLVTDD